MTLEEQRQELGRRHQALAATEQEMRQQVRALHDQVQQLRGALSVLDQLIREEGTRRDGLPAAATARAENLIGGGEDSDGDH